MSSPQTAVEVRISGRVQGVGFRWSTQLKAVELGVCGWVRNEIDGSVSGHFEGAAEAVERLLLWCQRGPRTANVVSVDTAAASLEGCTRFEVRN